MKKNYLLSAAAAFLLAVTGCSDDIETEAIPVVRAIAAKSI